MITRIPHSWQMKAIALSLVMNFPIVPSTSLFSIAHADQGRVAVSITDSLKASLVEAMKSRIADEAKQKNFEIKSIVKGEGVSNDQFDEVLQNTTIVFQSPAIVTYDISTINTIRVIAKGQYSVAEGVLTLAVTNEGKEEALAETLGLVGPKEVFAMIKTAIIESKKNSKRHQGTRGSSGDQVSAEVAKTSSARSASGPYNKARLIVVTPNENQVAFVKSRPGVKSARELESVRLSRLTPEQRQAETQALIAREMPKFEAAEARVNSTRAAKGLPAINVKQQLVASYEARHAKLQKNSRMNPAEVAKRNLLKKGAQLNVGALNAEIAIAAQKQEDAASVMKRTVIVDVKPGTKVEKLKKDLEAQGLTVSYDYLLNSEEGRNFHGSQKRVHKSMKKRLANPGNRSFKMDTFAAANASQAEARQVQAQLDGGTQTEAQLNALLGQAKHLSAAQGTFERGTPNSSGSGGGSSQFLGGSLPSDGYLINQWYIPNINGYSAWLNYNPAWAPSDPEVVVGVLDTGIDYGHDEFYDPFLGDSVIVPGIDNWDYVGLSEDENGHGTEVSGIIAAVGSNDWHFGGPSIAGLAWNTKTKIMPLRFQGPNGTGFTSDAVDAIYYGVDNGVWLLNMSFGNYSYNQALKNAIDYADVNNVVVVASAGNDGLDTDYQYDKHYPSGYNLPNILTVGGTNELNDVWFWSNYGYCTVDILAPAAGTGTYWDIFSTSLPDLNDPWAEFDEEEGTSYSAPMATATLANILSRWSSLSNAELMYAMRTGVDFDNFFHNYDLYSLSGGKLDMDLAMLQAEDIYFGVIGISTVYGNDLSCPNGNFDDTDYVAPSSGGGGGCGLADGNFQDATPGQIAGFFLPYLLACAIALGLYRRRKTA